MPKHSTSSRRIGAVELLCYQVLAVHRPDNLPLLAPAVLQFQHRPEPERQLWLQWRCHVRHNVALIDARGEQVECINQLLALACGPELVRSLEKQLQCCFDVKPQAAAAVLSKVSSTAGLAAQPMHCWQPHDACLRHDSVHKC
jgi:hypothetical protein